MYAVAAAAISSALAEAIMVYGYLACDSIPYGFSAAIASFVGNAVQRDVGAAASIAVITVFESGGLLKYIKSQHGTNLD